MKQPNMLVVVLSDGPGGSDVGTLLLASAMLNVAKEGCEIVFKGRLGTDMSGWEAGRKVALVGDFSGKRKFKALLRKSKHRLVHAISDFSVLEKLLGGEDTLGEHMAALREAAKLEHEGMRLLLLRAVLGARTDGDGEYLIRHFAKQIGADDRIWKMIHASSH